ncbi:MAG: filamentous hemagglutinin N-terminal domain-containing protein, partial [Achromobacter sp.]|uniref:two-partner secretion domain-containing protein n=1 Tax=Achromobacter sp. TaxID=134375 RepID=UPI00258C2EE3
MKKTTKKYAGHVPELSSKVCAAIYALLCSYSSIATAAPQGGTVTSGSATIGQAGSVTRIDQSTQRASINWQGFGIAAGETVNFNQPNASAITLNRVVGNERSVIEGALNANGKVFLINSNGVLFTRGSSVNTAGLVASTLNLSDADFNAGRYVFSGNGGSGSVINMGTLTAAPGGYVALLGRSVSNQGVIVATKGTVALGSGDATATLFASDVATAAAAPHVVGMSLDQFAMFVRELRLTPSLLPADIHAVFMVAAGMQPAALARMAAAAAAGGEAAAAAASATAPPVAVGTGSS